MQGPFKNFTLYAAMLLLICTTANGQAHVDSGARQAAAELEAAQGGADLLARLLDTMQNDMANVIAEKGHIEKSRAASIVEQILMPEIKSRLGELLVRLEDVYAENFSVAEMHQMADFFRSPVGIKYLEKMPLIIQEAGQVAGDWGKRVGEDAMRKNTQKLLDLGIKL